MALGVYQDLPLIEYVQKTLNSTLTPDQEKVCRLLRTPPYKVLVRSANTVGKSWIAAAVVNWWHDTFDPGVVLTTAPKMEQVTDILWKEVRRQRMGRPCKPTTLLPKSARMETSPTHFAHGLTARDANSFQGQHEASNLIVFDEAEGVPGEFWEAAEPMLGGENYGFLAIYNPTSQSGPTVEAERLVASGKFHLVTMSALDHPNIIHELRKEPAPYPRAVRLDRVKDMLAQWARRSAPNEDGAFELDGDWWVPGPIAEARILGRRPSAGFRSVWPTWVFEKALTTFQHSPASAFLQIGFDVGEMGDDPSAFCVRHGGNIIHLEEFHGPKDFSAGKKAAGRARDLAFHCATGLGKDPKRVPIVVDCGGGYGNEPVNHLRAEGYMAIPIMGSWTPGDEEQFPNLRSEMWVLSSRAAADGQLSFAQLPIREQEMLRVELTATEYDINLKGQMQVERKAETKKRIGRSTDCADSLLYSLVNVGMIEEKVAGRLETPGG
jgi:hypothetical protein